MTTGRQFTPWAAWFVVIRTDSGTLMEVPFATKIEAKAFLYKIPYYQQDVGGEWLKIQGATLRPSTLSLN